MNLPDRSTRMPAAKAMANNTMRDRGRFRIEEWFITWHLGRGESQVVSEREKPIFRTIVAGSLRRHVVQRCESLNLTGPNRCVFCIMSLGKWFVLSRISRSREHMVRRQTENPQRMARHEKKQTRTARGQTQRLARKTLEAQLAAQELLVPDFADV